MVFYKENTIHCEKLLAREVTIELGFNAFDFLQIRTVRRRYYWRLTGGGVVHLFLLGGNSPPPWKP